MPKLVLYGENGSSREFALDRERITIGRRARSDIHLDGSAVSGDHAVVITLGGDSFLEDLNSTNGTFVNQKSVQKCVLHDGDEIKIAGFKLRYTGEAVQSAEAGIPAGNTPTESVHRGMPTHLDQVTQLAPMDAATLLPDLNALRPSITLSGDQGKTEMFATMPTAAPKSGAVGVIRIVGGPGTGQLLPLTRPITSLGKPGIQVVAITLRDGRYYLGLVEGEELPTVNDKPASSLPYPLRNKDVISVAGVQMEFSLE